MANVAYKAGWRIGTDIGISIIIAVFTCLPFWMFFKWETTFFGIAIWAIIMAVYGTKMFLIEVLEYESKVVVNGITGDVTIFSPGAKLKYPWEQPSEEGVAGEGRVEDILLTFKGKKTTPAKDGGMMVSEWYGQYRPSFTNEEIHPEYLKIKESERARLIQEGINAEIGAYIAEQIVKEEAEEVRTESAKRIREYFDEKFILDGRPPHPLEERYGIKILMFKVEDVDYDQDTRTARLEAYKALQTRKAAEELAKIPKDARDAALMNAGKGVTKQITEVGGNGANAAVAILKEIFGKGK